MDLPRPSGPKCPTCGQQALPTKTRHGMRWEHCGLWAWGNYPLVDGATHAARVEAHRALDPLWQFGPYGSRSEVYAKLAVLMDLAPKDCHIKVMSREQAEKVIFLISDLRASWRRSE